MNKQLAHQDFMELKLKADAGKALNLRELSILTGFGYGKVRTWAQRGLPVFEGKIFWSDFLAWKASRLASAPGSVDGSHQPPQPAGKSEARMAKQGSPPGASRARGRHLEDVLK